MTAFLTAIIAGYLAGFICTWAQHRWRRRAYPPPGTGWCVNCSLNRGRTRVTTDGLDALLDHVEEHRATIGDAGVQIKYTREAPRDPRG